MAKKILLADDSLTIQKVVELTFSDSEYDLVCVSNGQRALDKATEDPPDLILADVVMPEKNGYEVCEAIKSNPNTARIPVILLSGTFEPFDRDRAERLGCDAIVSKPFDSQQLLRQVEALLSRPAQEMPSSATAAISMADVLPASATEVPPASRSTLEAGFASEDFTASVRKPKPPAADGGPDFFEEEYGRVDVESAIAAFEKAHPEFSDDEESVAPLDADRRQGEEFEEGREEPRPALAGWLREEPEKPAAEPGAPALILPTPAPFWVPEPEPDYSPIPFSADDSVSRRPPPPEPLPADEAPTGRIPLAAAYGPLEPAGGDDEAQDVTAPVPVIPAPEAPSRVETTPLAEAPVAAEATPVSREIEELASSTSIGRLREMLSSISRQAGAELSESDIDRLASRVVERLSERIVREIAWEVIPDVAELVIKQRIKELEAGIE